MSFIWPAMLVVLPIIPLLVVIYLLLQDRRRSILEQYGNFGSIQDASLRGPGIQRHIPPVFFLAGLSILLVALARPQTNVILPSVEGTVILAFDVSGSMAADDFQPTRMEAAKAAAREFVLSQPSTIQVGIVAFSDGGFAVHAPSNNQETLLAAIDRLSPQRATSLGNGIIASLNTIGFSMETLVPVPAPYGSADPSLQPPVNPVPPGNANPPSPESSIIILITDGENTAPPDPVLAAQAAAKLGVKIYTIGVGSPSGATLSIEGFTVVTQLDEAMLQQISQLTGGNYYNAQNEQDLQEIYRDLTPQLVLKEQKMEVTSLFAGASLLIMLIGGFLSFRWFNRLP
jgi:Ca-activated chloride channel family protein